jgi:DNA ligase (NAD+)
VLEWGDKLLANLASTGKATNVAELYKLSVDDLASLDRMGEKSATKCHEILHANKTIALEVLLGALSIPMIGQSTVKAVMGTGCTTLEQFYKLSVDDFERVPGLGPNKAKSLFDGLRANKGLIDDLLSQGIKIKEIKVGNLSNMSFCLTGAMVNKRQVLESMIADAGGIVKSGVNKDLSFLVIADVNSTSSKAVNARKFGTKLISEDQLLEMLNC